MRKPEVTTKKHLEIQISNPYGMEILQIGLEKAINEIEKRLDGFVTKGKILILAINDLGTEEPIKRALLETIGKEIKNLYDEAGFNTYIHLTLEYPAFFINYDLNFKVDE
jgi:hypothetical protein